MSALQQLATEMVRSERFTSKYVLRKSEWMEQPCWAWIAGCNKGGYGQYHFNGRAHGAHRVSYMGHIGPIADGLQIDHLCERKICCNPDHLDIVTDAEHRRRGRFRHTHCKRGHEQFADNVYTYPDGKFTCHVCMKIHGARSRIGRRPNLTKTQVLKIRALWERGGSASSPKNQHSPGLTYVKLGARFGISGTHARGIILRKYWRHV